MSAPKLHRAALKGAVAAAVLATDRHLVLRGSFAHDDFHLDGLGRSFSDVDTILPGCAEEQRLALALALAEEVEERTGLALRTSVQPANHQDAMSLEDQRFLTIGEWLRFRAIKDDARRSHLLAKCCLNVRRTRPGERYAATARAVGSEAAQQAWATKLGALRELPNSAASELLTTGNAPVEAVRLARIVERNEMADAAAYVVDLRGRLGIHPWLRELVAGLVEDTLATPICP